MKKASYLAAVAALAFLVPVLCGHGREFRREADPPQKGDKVVSLMHKKLTRSQKILEGLALNDFKMIRDNADDLVVISNMAEWKVLRTPTYETHSADFRRIADELSKNAKAKKLDAAALSYVELTLSCVRCHKYVREVRMTRAD